MNTYDVGGVQLQRPFRVQRLGHVAYIVDDQEACLKFYSDLLGLEVSDHVDFAAMFGCSTPGRDGNVYFMRMGGDHHSIVLFPQWVFPPRPGGFRPGTAHVGHLAWQLSSLDEVIAGNRWLKQEGCTEVRPGSRDPAGSNFNSTFLDPFGLPNEIYYGMDQIGWDGISKPPALWPAEDVMLPGPGESIAADGPMSRSAVKDGVDLRQGLHQRPWESSRFKVGGVSLPRPFKIIRNSPVGLFVPDVAEAAAFYRDKLGLRVTESTDLQGHVSMFLRAGSEHHTVALYPEPLRRQVGLAGDSLCSHVGLQVQNYRQLRDAITFLRDRGVSIHYLPAAMTPGIDYSALAVAPDGHTVLLHSSMEQIGWDGRPRPMAERVAATGPVDHWPETIPESPGTSGGFVYQGPIA